MSSERRTALAIGLGIVALFLLLVVVLPAIDAATRPAPPGDALVVSAADLPEGVSAWTVAERRIFLVPDGDSITAFLAYATHLEDERIWWCPTLDAFVPPAHGEAYDRSGRIIVGPAERALDRLPVERDGSSIVIRATPVTTGASMQDEGAHAVRSWDPHRADFCPQHVE